MCVVLHTSYDLMGAGCVYSGTVCIYEVLHASVAPQNGIRFAEGGQQRRAFICVYINFYRVDASFQKQKTAD